MKINEIDLHTPDQMEFADLALRKARRMIMRDRTLFPKWFELLGVSFSGPGLFWPTKGKIIRPHDNFIFTVTDDLRMDLDSWSTGQLRASTYFWLYIKPSIEIDKNNINLDQYKNDIQAFIANTVRASYPIFHNILYDSVEIRNMSWNIKNQISVMAKAADVANLVQPIISDNTRLVTTLFTGRKLPEFAKLIRDSYAS